MKKCFVGAVVLAAMTLQPQESSAQYTYFPPIYAQSAVSQYGLDYARAKSRSDSLRRSRRSRKSRLSKRSHRSRRTRYTHTSRRRSTRR